MKTAKQIGKILTDYVSQDVVLDVAASLLGRLQKVTPVDTGHARSSWVPTEGTPASVVLPKSDVQLKGALTSKGSKTDMYLTSNAPYMRKLNYEGTSQQASVLFVERAVAQTTKEYK